MELRLRGEASPCADGDETELREEHEENLRLCDGFLIYFGEGNERWLSKNLGDLKKARGLGREKPILAKAIYVAPPGGPAKARYRTLEAVVIQGGEAFAPAQLDAFLAPFAGRGAGRERPGGRRERSVQPLSRAAAFRGARGLPLLRPRAAYRRAAAPAAPATVSWR